MRTRGHVFVAIAIALLLFMALAGSVGAQTFWQRFDNVMVKQFYATGPSTFTDATILGTLSAPTVTMTDATTWTVSSLTADVGLTAGTFTADSADITTATVTSLSADAFDGDLLVNGNAAITGTLTVTGTSNLVGNATAAGTFAANGASLSVAKTLNLTRQSAIAVTASSIITPTGTFQELTAASPVTATLSDPAAAGQTLILFNSTANAITIVDGSGRYFAGDIVLAAYDNATLISTAQGSWMEIGRSDN